MFDITPWLSIPESEIEIVFIQAAGPGGQNVNKVASAAQLRLDVRHSPSLPEEVKQRLASLAGRRMTADGELLILAKRYRSQEQNRADALRRLAVLIQKATITPKLRRQTKPSPTVKAARLKAKKHRGAIKRLRGKSPEEFDK
jgi:ribosome-associated protein